MPPDGGGQVCVFGDFYSGKQRIEFFFIKIVKENVVIFEFQHFKHLVSDGVVETQGVGMGKNY